MLLTFIGAIQIVIGALLLIFGSVPAMFVFLLGSGAFGGSAAFTLPALGGSSIPPVQFALVFMVLRLMLPGAGQVARIPEALRANAPLLLFVLWSVILAVLAPRIFQGQIEVTPLRGRVEARYLSIEAFIYSTRPLAPSTQNITTAIYLAGTLLLALSSYIACTYQRGREFFVRAAAGIAVFHVAMGVIGIMARGTAADQYLDLLRNGNYAQINNSYKGFVRVNGIFPEASSYAIYAFVWFVFLAECWFRRVHSRWTGPAAMMLAVILVFSTSSSAYGSLALYSAMVVVRAVMFPQSLRLDKALSLGAALLLLVIISAAMMLFNPAFANDFVGLVQHMTVDKQQSLSGQQRTFWAQQGLNAFLVTDGVGIGPGSFRSSSLATAILGSTGLIGVLAFLTYVIKVWKPLRASTYLVSDDEATSIGVAASWAVMMLLGIASITAPSSDPGPEFAIFAGAALALRRFAPPIPQRMMGTRFARFRAPGDIRAQPQT